MEAIVTLYNIKRCGYYVNDDHELGNARAVFEGLSQWTRGLQSIGESSTYTVGADDSILRAFCVDLKELSGGRAYLLVTWNELPRIEEGVQVLQVSSQIGQAMVSNVEIDALSLPGYPSYFCVLPDQNLVVNFRFEQRLNGSRQFQRYIEGFLAWASQWCFFDEEDDESIIGYGDSEPVEGLVPSFSTSLVRVAGRIDFLRGRVGDIRKVTRRAVVEPTIENHKTFLDRAYEFLGLRPNNRLRAGIPFEYEFKLRLTPARFEDIVANYENGQGEDAWNDVGFTLARSQKVHWLSGALARDKLDLDVQLSQGGMIEVGSLVRVLEDRLQGIVDALRR